jgi:hypothetical protein
MVAHNTVHREDYFFMLRQPPLGHGLRNVEASRPHPDTPQCVGPLWTSDQADAQTSTWLLVHIPVSREIYPWPRRDSNPQYPAASGRRPTP